MDKESLGQNVDDNLAQENALVVRDVDEGMNEKSLEEGQNGLVVRDVDEGMNDGLIAPKCDEQCLDGNNMLSKDDEVDVHTVLENLAQNSECWFDVLSKCKPEMDILKLVLAVKKYREISVIAS